MRSHGGKISPKRRRDRLRISPNALRAFAPHLADEREAVNPCLIDTVRHEHSRLAAATA